MKTKGKLKFGLVLTLDYEVHGNGSGEFENWAHFPTSQMLDILDECGARLTIMAEMGHYWSMKKYKGLFSPETNLFESQLKDAIRRGHDVQFHFHPQWIDAEYRKGEWHLDFSGKSIGRLCQNYDEAYYYLRKGKEELENLLTPVNPGYRCVAFRSGFLQMQPSGNIIKALLDAGYQVDTSVSKGMKASDKLISVDFSSAFSKCLPWRTSPSEICDRDKNGRLIEFPILSEDIDIVDKISRKVFIARNSGNIMRVINKFMSSYDKGMMPECEPASRIRKLGKAIDIRWHYVDYCTQEYQDTLQYLISNISDCRKKSEYNYIPIVLIGHSKDFFFANNLKLFIEGCKRIKDLEFNTLSGAVDAFINQENKQAV